MNKIIAVNCGTIVTDSPLRGFQSESDAFDNNAIKHEMGKLIAKLVIANIIRIDWRDINFTKNIYGKPALVGSINHPLYFSLSYTSNWIFLAISTETDIGIDAELIQPINIDTASEFCIDREMKVIKSNPNKSLENYYKLWTLKESFLKNIGMGLSYPVKNIEFTLSKHKIKCYNKSKIVGDCFFKIYKLKNILISLCVKNQNFPKKLEIYSSLDEFQRSFNKNQYQNVKNYADATT